MPRAIWTVSAAVMTVGLLVVLLMRGNDASASLATAFLLSLLVPLAMALGVAFMYGPENDAGLELTLATPTAPRLVLVSRLVLVAGYNCCLALGLTVALAALRGGEIVPLAALWIGPTLLLAGLSLLLSVAISSTAAVAGAAAVLCLHVITSASTLLSGGAGSDLPLVAALWSTNPLLLLVAALLFVGAVLAAPRREQLAARHDR
jgi:hypothetical protein